MAVTTAVLSGSITDVVGDLDSKYLARVVLVIEANTAGSVLRDTSGDRLMVGAKRVAVDKTTGDYSVTLVKTNSADIVPSDDRLYQATLIFPSGHPGRGNSAVTSGWFELEADASLSDEGIWQGIEVTAVSSAVYASLTEMLADATTSAEAAETARLAAEAARDEATTIVVADLDDAAAVLVPDTGTATGAALAATLVGQAELVIDTRKGEFAVSEDTADVTANTEALNAALLHIHNRVDLKTGLGKLLVADDVPINAPLVMQIGTHLTGEAGWWGNGGAGGLGGHGTGRPRLRHATAIDEPFIIFAVNVASTAGPFAITQIQFKGHPDETNAPGIDTVDENGDIARMQDGCWIDKVLGRTLGGPLVRLRSAGPMRLGYLESIFCEGTLWLDDDGSNPGYGHVNNVTVETISSDGDYGDYAVKASGLFPHAMVEIGSIKVEQRADIDRGNAIGSQHAALLDNCEGRIIVRSSYHNSITGVKPGDSVAVTGTKRPTLDITAKPRVLLTETGTDPLLINDDVAGEDVPYTTSTVRFGPEKKWGATDRRVLRLPGTAGNYASTTDAAALDLTGDIVLEARIVHDTTPAATASLEAKWDAGTNQRSYQLTIGTNDKLNFLTTTDGTAATINGLESTIALPHSSEPIYVRGTRAAGTGAVLFYTSRDGVNWTQFGGTPAGTPVGTAVFSGSAPLTVGATATGAAPYAGTIYEARVKNAIGASTDVVRFDAATMRGATGESTTGETWTINGHAWRWVDQVEVNTTPTISAFARTVLDDADAAAARVTLGVTPLVDAKTPPMLRPTTGQWISQWAASWTAGALTADQVHYIPFIVTDLDAFDQIAVELTTAPGTSCTERMNIYTADAATRRPGTAILTDVTVSTLAATSLGFRTASISWTPTATGLYYLAVAVQSVVGAAPQYRLANSAPIPGLPTSGGIATAPGKCFRETGVAGAFPSSATPTGVWNGTTPIVQLHRV